MFAQRPCAEGDHEMKTRIAAAVVLALLTWRHPRGPSARGCYGRSRLIPSINKNSPPDASATSWAAASGTSSEEHCRIAMPAVTSTARRNTMPAGVGPLIGTPPYIAKYRGVCLPDSIDPRGPKSATR